MQLIRTVLARGNGATVVHRLLERYFTGYQLSEIDARIAACPPLYRLASRPLFAGADIAHIVADYGNAPAPRDCAQLVAFHNFYIDEEYLVQATPAQRLYYRRVMAPAVSRSVAGADRIVVVSRFLADMVRKLCPPVSVEIIYNGIDTDRFVPLRDSGDRPLRALFVGNPSRRKGFDMLGRIAAGLPAGAELAYTSGLRNENPTAVGLRSLGRVPYERMHRLYQTADLLLFPTRREGFGLCVAEAMASGLPVVSTRCSAIPELVDEGKGGFLLAPGDVTGMSRAVNRLLGDPGLRADMGAYNRERALRDFSLLRMVKHYRELFSTVRR
jgi:L-malate glycosyltransferase